MKTNSETFGQRLKRLREAKGWTHRQLMEEADHYIDTEALISAELSVVPDIWPAFTMSRVSKAFGVSMDYLYHGVDPIAKALGSPTANTPGKRIRQRRDELGWSFHDLYRKSHGLSELGLARLECDATKEPVGAYRTELSSIAVWLGVNPEWILTGNEPKFPAKQKASNAEWIESVDLGRTRTEGGWCEATLIVTMKPEYLEKVREAIRAGRAVECA